jgi:type IV pilus assembly protein PilQ
MERVERPPVTRTYTISYAKVKDVETKLVNLLSREDTEAGIKAGSVVSDERTSTLVVTDIEERFGDIERIIHQFDTPTPAVQIEARIVTVTNSYQKDLGIQWGFNYVADQAHGNATAFEFPNRIGVGGNVGTGGEGFVVNLPAASPTAGIGIALGHIADTLSLDVRLSALEQMGQLEILSNPKVFVVQNEQAIINVGRQLPVPRTDSEGNRTVEFKDVGIKLQVKPQVTADRRVFLEVEVERSDKGEDVETTEGRQFSIDTQRAETKVLLNDGETSVIGGLFQQTKENREGGVPFFSKIPILGYLFKSKRVTDDRSELLIFLTPKIVQPL